MNAGFEKAWLPLIGREATEELWRFRRTVLVITPVDLVAAVGAGALIGTGVVGDLIGVALSIVAVVCLTEFIRAQWRTAAAVSVWFGVDRMRWLPRMTTHRFEEWRKLRGFMTPDEREVRPRATATSRPET